MKFKKIGKRNYLEAAVDSSSSQLRICLTLRLKIEADCLTSLLSRRTTALTPATVRMKLVKAISFYRLLLQSSNYNWCQLRCEGLLLRRFSIQTKLLGYLLDHMGLKILGPTFFLIFGYFRLSKITDLPHAACTCTCFLL